jgi:hypothetical protein
MKAADTRELLGELPKGLLFARWVDYKSLGIKVEYRPVWRTYYTPKDELRIEAVPIVTNVKVLPLSDILPGLHLFDCFEMPGRVGQIFVVGNDVTPQQLILDGLPLYAGHVLTRENLRAADWRLKRLTLLGVRASVSLLDDSQPKFKDILVEVHECPVVAYVLAGLPYALWPQVFPGQ